MKQANGSVKLSKEAEVPIKEVTPLETILLTAEHHKNVGGPVVFVDKATVKDAVTIDVPEYEKEVEVPEVTKDEVVTPEVKDASGKVTTPAVVKKVVVTPATVKKEKVPAKTHPRTTDEEYDRLRIKYGAAKVRAVRNEVHDIPDDFDKATERGVKVVLPSSNLSQTKIL